MTEQFRPDESLSAIHQERDGLRREVNFLNGQEKGAYVGVLTNSSVDIISTLYPQIADGMLRLYNYVEKEVTDPLSPQGFLNRHIRNVFINGTLLSNDQVDRLRKEMEEGKYSKQFEIHKRFREAAAYSSTTNSNRRERLDQYRDIHGEDDLVFNKRACLARVTAVKNDLKAIYGETNYKQALLTELILSAPFLGTVVRWGERIDDDARQRHQAYLNEINQFVEKFDFDKRVKNFEEQTDKYQVRWTDEPTVYDIPEFDKEYARRVYDHAKDIMEGKISLDQLYSILSETILRRGKVFKAQMINDGGISVLQVLPEQLLPVYFDDIAGYGDQKKFLEILAAKTGASDPTVDNIRMIILAGKPGLGKSLGVRAFLNALPENAKGVVISLDSESAQRGSMPEYDGLMRLAAFHPELHIFAVIEDIDALAGDRLHYAGTRKFLELDSTNSDSSPRNFHLIATTNRPDVIDPAVTRPGRTAKILVYKEPQQDERKEIARIHGEKNNYQLSEKALDLIAAKADGFTPDEIRHVIWSLRFEDVGNPTNEDIEKAIKEIHNRHSIEEEAKSLYGKQAR